MTAQVDVIVPVHSQTRPIARLAESVLMHTRLPVRIIVVAHNIDASLVASSLREFASDPRVEIVELRDGIPSPAGPLNAGLDRVTAPWFTKIDSDDHLRPGAIDGWVERAVSTGADAVIPPMVLPASGVGFPTPPRRPFRRRLDPVRDRLSYRTSTMGLFDAELRDLARPIAGLETGEDILPSIRLWFGARRIVAARERDAYLVGEGAEDRVTESGRPFAAELAFAQVIGDDAAWNRMSREARDAVTRKLIRVHVLGALGRRGVTAEAIAASGRALEVLIGTDPSPLKPLSRLDNELIAALRSSDVTQSEIGALVERRRRYAQPAALLTPALRHVAHRDGPVRFLAASLLAQRRAGRAALAT
ncbi:glycosyltransferase family A protein [Microbacterium hydrocarbonoxydans]|uniref:glycosyltransferase family A protein n=1 Tax=Microbacterium hydrocarbonoxydans TaxID=273678 RepID=UPI0013DAA992|nr:glycosyltransferase family A protein [Microbacterium hydrocarbonoxydans]